MEEKNIKCYPVVIPTLNRYEHFKRCVESLAQNTHADKTELVIGLDFPSSEKYIEGYDKIKAYIPSITGFEKITVFERKENLGPSLNLVQLKDYAFDRYDAVIVSEDDNEFSPCFLDFMNQCLERYKDDKSIMSVCGYTNIDFLNITDRGILFSFNSSAWGIGLWKEKEKWLSDRSHIVQDIWRNHFWKLFGKCPAVADMFSIMVQRGLSWGDTIRTSYNILHNKYQVIPYMSLVRNHGHDGSGEHCKNDGGTLECQNILSVRRFNLDQISYEGIRLNSVVEFFYLLPQNRIKAVYYVIIKSFDCYKRLREAKNRNLNYYAYY